MFNHGRLYTCIETSMVQPIKMHSEATLVCNWLTVRKAGALVLPRNLHGLGLKIGYDAYVVITHQKTT